MSSQSTKDTLQDLDQTKFLGQSTRTQMPLVSPLLTETFSVIAPLVDQDGNPRVIDWSLIQESNALLLDQTYQVRHETSQLYRIRKVRLSELHRLRRVESRDLGKHHASLKRSLLGSYGEEALSLMGLEAPASAAYAAVRERCQDAVSRMRNPGLLAKLGKRRPGSPTLDFAELAQELEDAIAVYDDLERDTNEAKKLRDEALVEQRAARKRHRRLYVNIARVQEGFYRLAGLDELADLIRATIPGRKTRSEEPETETPEEPTA